jgi:hypothetical protein
MNNVSSAAVSFSCDRTHNRTSASCKRYALGDWLGQLVHTSLALLCTAKLTGFQYLTAWCEHVDYNGLH